MGPEGPGFKSRRPDSPPTWSPDAARKAHAARAAARALEALYRQADATWSGFRCPASAECCQLAVTGREPWLWALPVLFAAWVNLHGGALAGAGVLGLWIAVRAVDRLRADPGDPARRLGDVVSLGLLGVACGLALLLNPYRAGLVEFLLRTATVPRPEISEWTPLGLLSLPGQLYLGLLALGVAALARSGRPRRPEAPITSMRVADALPLRSTQSRSPNFSAAALLLRPSRTNVVSGP